MNKSLKYLTTMHITANYCSLYSEIISIWIRALTTHDNCRSQIIFSVQETYCQLKWERKTQKRNMYDLKKTKNRNNILRSLYMIYDLNYLFMLSFFPIYVLFIYFYFTNKWLIHFCISTLIHKHNKLLLIYPQNSSAFMCWDLF